MNSAVFSRTVFNLPRRLGSWNLVSRSCLHTQSHAKVTKSIIPLLDLKLRVEAQVKQRPLLDGKSEMLSLTAAFWANAILPKIEITDPNKKAPMGRECYDESIITPEPGLTNNSPLVEPTPTVIIEKQAHRLLRIKKKKMKVHRRKRRWKKYWARWRKNYQRKEIKREVALRQKLQMKVNEAEKFDARKYMDEYLEDCKYELVPKTIKGQRLPKFLIKELMEEEKKQEKRKNMNETNLLTGEPLILPNESVEDFLKRMQK